MVFAKIIAAAKGKRTRAEIARDIAAAVNENYIECVDPDDPGFGALIDWVVRVLRELSKEPDEIGIYAAEVAKLLQAQDE